MTGMNWGRVNRENAAIRESNRMLEPESRRSDEQKLRKRKKNRRAKRKRMTEKERAMAWRGQNRLTS